MTYASSTAAWVRSSVDDQPFIRSDPVACLTRFGQILRAEGLSISSGEIVDFCRAAATLSAGEIYWAGLATLVRDRDQIATYDQAFRGFFGGQLVDGEGPAQPNQTPPERNAPGMGQLEPADEDASPEQQAALASSVELLQQKSFAECSEEELRALFRVDRHLKVATRRSRRYRASRAGSPDLRRTLRACFKTGAEPVNRAWRARKPRERRVVLLLDVSGSMTAYTRALLYFAHAGVRNRRDWEAFCFATRLTRVTQALAAGTPDEALARAADKVVDWDGGTRIGESLKRFLDEFGHLGLARGSCVVICSDGLELGDPEMLGEQMLRLSRLAYRIVWLNPLKEDLAYEPLVRGMRAALPHIDIFASAHNLVSLADAMTETLMPARRGR